MVSNQLNIGNQKWKHTPNTNRDQYPSPYQHTDQYKYRDPARYHYQHQYKSKWQYADNGADQLHQHAEHFNTASHNINTAITTTKHAHASLTCYQSQHSITHTTHYNEPVQHMDAETLTQRTQSKQRTSTRNTS